MTQRSSDPVKHRSSSGTSLTEIFLRLVGTGHLTEKLVFLFSYGLFCFVIGFAVSDQLTKSELLALQSRQSEKVKETAPASESASSPEVSAPVDPKTSEQTD